MLALLAAMKQEIAGLKELMAVEEVIAADGCRIFRGTCKQKPVLLVQTGVGRENAERAARLTLERYPVSALVSFGFAGALTPEAIVGDIVVGAELVCGDAGPSAVCHSDADLLECSLRVLVGGITRVRQGKEVSVTRAVCQPEAKLALGEACHSDIVDMESYWVARIAAEKQVPFLAVRSVSDSAADALPPLGRLVDARHRLVPARAIPYFLVHPAQLLRFLALRRNMRRAGARLTDFLALLVEKLP